MPKKAISVTLEADNLTWLQGRVGAAGLRSVSGLLDRLVAEARSKGSVGPIASVVGTIDIDASDPLLRRADDAVRDLIDRSVGRPVSVSEADVSPRAATPARQTARTRPAAPRAARAAGRARTTRKARRG
jgi:hypothetical protein